MVTLHGKDTQEHTQITMVVTYVIEGTNISAFGHILSAVVNCRHGDNFWNFTIFHFSNLAYGIFYVKIHGSKGFPLEILKILWKKSTRISNNNKKLPITLISKFILKLPVL